MLLFLPLFFSTHFDLYVLENIDLFAHILSAIKMKSFNFTTVVKTYEKKRALIKYEGKQADKEIQTIKEDIERTYFDPIDINDHEREVLRKVLYEILITMPIEYVQGMSEIAAVFVYHYFKEEINAVEDDAIVIDALLLKKTRITITNILLEKYMPLIDQEFKLYLHYNEVFMKLMKARGYDLNKEETLTHMNTILTWFTRNASSYEIMTTFLGYILACPTTTPFLLLIKYFQEINDGEKIKTTDEDLYEQLIELEKEFLVVEASMGEKKFQIEPKTIIIGGVIIGLAAAVFYKLFKKND